MDKTEIPPFAHQDKWTEWNGRGFIPGSNESEADFFRRIEFCEQLEKLLEEKVGASLPFRSDSKAHKILQESLEETKTLFGIAPEWVPLFFNNHQLAPWHGGCAWIFQLDDTTPTAAFLQLRARFRDHETYLKIYQRKELVAHELAHIGRMMYEEPQFEELFAYQTSTTPWRRWLGPLIRSSKESFFFISALGLYLITLLALTSIEHPMAKTVSTGFQLFFIFLVLLALGRVVWIQSVYQRCLKKLEWYAEPTHLAYRLKDEEIKKFASMSSEEVRAYVDNQQSFRWHFLNHIYPGIQGHANST